MSWPFWVVQSSSGFRKQTLVWFANLSCSNWFTINNFCLLSVFIMSWEISPLTTIWWWFIFFYKNNTIQISPLDISSRLSVSKFFVTQFVTTCLSYCSWETFLNLYRLFWVLSPPNIAHFMVSSSKVFVPELAIFHQICRDGIFYDKCRCDTFCFLECCMSVMTSKPPVLVKPSTSVGGSQRKIVTLW